MAAQTPPTPFPRLKMIEAALISLTLVTMIGVLMATILPFVPGPLLMWLVALAFGLLNEFDRLPLIVFAMMTGLMLLGMTSDIWLTLLGMRAHGSSCWSALGTIIGAIAGTFLIPIPLCGTFIGSVIGGLSFELLRVRNLREAITAGNSAAKSFIYSFVFEIVATTLIFLMFLASLSLTG